MIAHGHARLVDFDLDPAKTHLNHGSYGAVPRVLTAAQEQWHRQIERNPTGFFRSSLPALLRQSAVRLAAQLGGQGGDWVFVDNATSAANAVLANLELGSGDEVLTTAEVYNAVRQALHHHARRRGATVIELPLPIPLPDAATVTAAVVDRLNRRTKAVFIDHVTSRSGLVLPVAAIAAHCRQAQVPLFVDGAHAPGMLALDVPALGVDWYAGNGHKWLSAPRGCGFLWCHPRHQEHIHPLVISHGYGAGYCAEFDWVGTRDPSAWLTLPDALDWHEAMGGTRSMARNRALAQAMGEALATTLGGPLAGPPSMLGSMAAVRVDAVPPGLPREARALAASLDEDHDLVVSVNEISGAPWLRVSAALYNELEDCTALIAALTG